MTSLHEKHYNGNMGIVETSTTCKKCFQFGLIFYFVLAFSGFAAMAQDECEWHSFHGPDRTNKSLETGLLKVWPTEGPKLAWTVSGLGEGYSSVTIADGYLYTAGMADKQTYVFAYDLNGKQVWKKANGQAWETTMSHARTYTGSRSTPTYDDGIVYHLSDMGRLAAFNYKTGQEIWAHELRELFDAKIPEYGYSESILIDGDRLYCNPAGKKAFMICLNKKSGKLIWVNTEIPGTVGFSSPIIADSGGYRQVINMTSNCLYGVDTKTGKLLWSMAYENSRSNNCTDAIFQDGYVFTSSGYGKGSILIKLTASGKEIIPETVWQTDLMDNHHGGVILNDGYFYGAGDRNRGWYCLDFMTGKQIWKSSGKGSLTYADGLLYCLDERGTMTLVSATPEKYNEMSTFKVPSGGKGMHWAHPVVCGGRLYIRHTDKLFAYNIRGE